MFKLHFSYYNRPAKFKVGLFFLWEVFSKLSNLTHCRDWGRVTSLSDVK